MDANPAPGAVPAVAGIDKVVADPAAPAASTGAPSASANAFAGAKTVDEKKDEPSAAAPKADEPVAPVAPAAPKAATVEDASDKGTPVATTATEPSKPIPGLSSTASAAPVTAETTAADGAKDAAEPADKTDVTADELVQDKPIGANGVKSPGKDTEMTGALKDTDAAPAAAPAAPVVEEPAAAAVADKATGSGEREAAPQADPANDRVEPVADKKRKADELEPEVDSAAPANGDSKKRKPGRPPKAVANGNGNGHGEEKEGLGEKLVKKAKKVLPTAGKTERKTRSQGPA